MSQETIICLCCNNEYDDLDEFSSSHSMNFNKKQIKRLKKDDLIKKYCGECLVYHVCHRCGDVNKEENTFVCEYCESHVFLQTENCNCTAIAQCQSDIVTCKFCIKKDTLKVQCDKCKKEKLIHNFYQQDQPICWDGGEELICKHCKV